MDVPALTDSLMALEPMAQLVVLVSIATGLGVNICTEPCVEGLHFAYVWEAPTEGPAPDLYFIEISHDDGATWAPYSYTEERRVTVGIEHRGARLRASGVIRRDGGAVVGTASIPCEPQPTVFTRTGAVQ